MASGIRVDHSDLDGCAFRVLGAGVVVIAIAAKTGNLTSSIPAGSA